MGSVSSSIGNVVGSVLGGVTKGITDPLQNNFQAANPVTPEQLAQAQQQTQLGLTGQQQLAQSLAAQNGLQNQTNVFGQQQQLASALQDRANGVGPNPAQAQLAQQTGNNISQQAALMAGQRGAGANAGLIAREAALQGGNMQQQSVGQAATLQAQQQIAAQQQLAAQQQAMQQVSANQVGNQIAGQNAYTGAALQNQGNMMGANNSSNQINAGVAQGNAQMRGQIAGGILQGGSSALTAMLAYKGGVIDPHHMEMAKIYHPQMADGGSVWDTVKAAFQEDPKTNSNAHPLNADKTKAFIAGGNFNHGGEVDAVLSPGEKYVSPKEAVEVAKGKKSLESAGKKVPGKAEVKGDSLKNDKVPAKLEEGGIVIPRSVMNAKDPVKEGTKFLVEALKKHSKHGAEEDDFKMALKNAIASRSK